MARSSIRTLYLRHSHSSQSKSRVAANTFTSKIAPQREYFYFLDSKGQIFLEECLHRNFVTSLKDVAFLNFFFRQLQPNFTGERTNYPLVSPCGKELNFVKIDDSLACSVFSTMVNDSGELFLQMGGSTVREKFEPRHLAVDVASGRFYHLIQSHKKLSGLYGLLHSPLATQLSSNIIWDEDKFYYSTLSEKHIIKSINDASLRKEKV